MANIIRRYLVPSLALLLLSVDLQAQTAPLEQAARTLAEVSRTQVRSFSTQDFGRERYTNARSVLVSEADAPRMLEQVRSKLPAGAVAFVGVTRNLAKPKPSGVELVVAEGRSQFDILRVAASDGINHGLQTEDLIRELMIWDSEFGIDIWQAETDTEQLRLKALPGDLSTFAKRVYEFCPDVVEQGVGSVAALQRAIEREKAVYLWWD